jgi:hypothetical protein
MGVYQEEALYLSRPQYSADHSTAEGRRSKHRLKRARGKRTVEPELGGIVEASCGRRRPRCSDLITSERLLDYIDMFS